nr:MAG TPA: hypothetical protein [Caudoviricetes sp.]
MAALRVGRRNAVQVKQCRREAIQVHRRTCNSSPAIWKDHVITAYPHLAYA